MTDLWSPFPTLMEGPVEQWHWPKPPFVWQHVPAPDNNVPQPCRIETMTGETLDGEMLAFDPPSTCLSYRQGSVHAAYTVPFTRVRRLTLTVGLRAVERRAGAPIEHVPIAAQLCEYRLQTIDTQDPLSGHTAGHVETSDGLYLFTPVDTDRSIRRVFVPRSTYTRCEFGPTAAEAAAKIWIATPQELLAAIELQRRKPVVPIGQSLLSLGLVTQAQLDNTLAQQDGKKPLGEMLVASGVISRADLKTAIAHKMGYPMVDLTRFPPDPAAQRHIPIRVALEYKALPLMIDGQRLIVAINEPSRAAQLSKLHTLSRITIVPVHASEGQIMITLGKLSQRDAWSHVGQYPGALTTSS